MPHNHYRPATTGQLEISRRIDLLRYLLIAGIVLLHAPPYVALSALSEDPSAFALMKSFFQNVLFRISVPTLAAVSGYLMLGRAMAAYRQLVAKKTRTILLPMLIWNTIAFALLFAATVAGGVARAENGGSISPYPFQLWTTIDGILGFSGKVFWNYPLNFLRDLFVLILLAPVVAFLLKHAPYLGLVLWSAVFFFNLEGMLIGRAAMPITFYLGGLAATQKWNLLALDRYRALALTILVAASCAILAFRVEDQRLFRTVAPLLVWPAASWLIGTRIGEFMIRHAHKSFFIFLSHAFGLKAYSLLFDKFLPFVPEYIAWICMPVATIATCHLAYKLMSAVAPGALGWLTGGRTESSGREAASMSNPSTGRAGPVTVS